MFRVEKMTTGDFQFAVELANTISWNMTVSDFEFNKRLEPDGCFVLFDNLERVGVATCISYGCSGWFGNLVVKEGCRERGGGSMLVNHALEYLKEAGATSVGLYAYPFLKNFYKNLGFTPYEDFVVLKADSVFAYSRLESDFRKIGNQDLSSLADFDARCIGVSRRKLLKEIIEEKNNLGYFCSNGNEIIGYLMTKIFNEIAEIGPLVCLRNQGNTAKSLFNRVLNDLKGLEAYVYLPKKEKELLELVKHAGFIEQFSLVRMFLGSPAAKNCLYSAESLERG